ncbi:MAG TPA: peptide ligase PGM1-related protein [Lapillicoccus sp.]|nr:peptide ligase PGM1-related protein [Lapillicoccus sp.]
MNTRLDALSEDERNEAFDRLQSGLPSVWRAFRSNDPRESVVVVPSMTLGRMGAGSGAANQALEERFLFMLLLLRQPRLKVIYVTSMPIDPAIIEYYLSLLPGVIPSHARARLTMVSVGDSSATPLTEKLLARPRLVSQIRALIPDLTFSHMVPYNTTRLERDLALVLGIPMYGADPRHFPIGTKTGSREAFSAAGISHPMGVNDVRSLDDVVSALAGLRAARPHATAAMVKLNEGVSGAGNAEVDLTGLPASGEEAERDALADRVRTMTLESTKVDVPTFLERLNERAGIVEERVTGDELRSPSVQLRITPLGAVELLSTHDQILGGKTGQSYLGCRFPADPAYAGVISADAMKVGEVLAGKGVLGRFAIDFVVSRTNGHWTSDAIEINLRRGGTTHPFLTLQFLTDGRYDAESSRFLTPAGDERHLVATDHFEDASLSGLRIADLFDLVAISGIHYDQVRERGVVLHMMSAITELGRVGLTAVGATADEAAERYADAEDRLRGDAQVSLEPHVVW